MADSPYYHPDGRAFRLTSQRVAAPSAADLDTARNTSYLHPRPGSMLRLSDTATVMPRAERMDHDRDMPLNLRVGHLAAAAPHIPHHVIHTMVHNSPNMTVEELAEVLQLVAWEEVGLNALREAPPPPREAPPLPVLDAETREAPLQCLVRPKGRRRKGATARLQNSSFGPPEPKPPPASPAPWTCGECGAETDPAIPTCRACLASRPLPGWECPACTLANVAEAGKCAACEGPRPEAGGSGARSIAKGIPLPESALTFRFEPQLILHYELQPGLVLVKSMMDIRTQQWVVDEAFRLGNNPDGRTGGFFRVTEDGQVTLNQTHRAQFGEHIDAFAPHFRELCLHFFQYARPLSASMPDMAAHWCQFNFYAPASKGIAWHRDGDETEERLRAGTGRPVVSFSLGDSCDFRWKNRTHEDDNVIRLESGDVLLFGGPSRGILHSVTRVHPNTCPRLLRMRAGRLNLTYRHSHAEDN